MIKRLLLTAALAAVSAGVASATPITGSFSLASFSGSFVGGSGTAATATGLDFGDAFSATGAGNGYGTNGTVLIGNATGSFAGLNGTFASISDVSLGNTANSLASTFLSFSTNPITISFNNASLTRSTLGTSVTLAGLATFSDGTAADTTIGTFSLAANSQNGSATNPQFTFTGNASAVTPEPSTFALLGTGLLGLGGVMRKVRYGA